jgi:glyoxylase I family protein
MTGIRGYHHLSLSVTNLQESAQWYREVLGLEIDAEIEGVGFRRVRLRAPGSGVTMTLTSHERQRGERFDERRAGMDHVSFDVGGIEEVNEFKRRFERLGIEHSDVKASGTGSAMITLRDPDNIQLEVFGGPTERALAAGGAGG